MNNVVVSVTLLCLTSVCAMAQSISTVQFESASYTVKESAGSVTIVVKRNGPPGETAYVGYYTRDGTAAHGEDYLEQSDYIQFVGETNLSFSIPILNDTLPEPDKTFSVILFNPDPFDTELGDVATAVVTILDDDRGVQFSSYAFDVNEAAGVALITVLARTESTNGCSVDYSTDGCSATPGLDYVPQSGTLNFAVGEMEKAILIPILDDSLVEGDETVNLRLSHPVGILPGAITNAVLRIRDNDFPIDADATVAPRRVGLWSATKGEASAIAVSGNHAYVTVDEYQLQVLDISDIASIQRVAQYETSARISDVVVSGNYAYLAAGALEVIDIHDPLHPTRVGRYDSPSSALAVAVSGGYAFLAAGTNGLEVIDVSDPGNPLRVGGVANSILHPFGTAEGIAVSGNFAYVVGAYIGLQVMDISDPDNPRRIGEYPLPFSYVWRVRLAGNHAYMGVWNDGLHVIDVSNPSNPQRVGGYDDQALEFVDLAVADGVAYLSEIQGTGDGFLVLDVTLPSNPRRVGSYLTGASRRMAVAGNRAFVTGGFGVEVLNIALPTNVVRAGIYPSLSSGPTGVAVSGNYVYLTAGTAGMHIIDATDPAKPRWVGRAATKSNATGAVAMGCDLVLVADDGGLEMFDVKNPANPRLVGTLLDLFHLTAVALEGTRAFVIWRNNFDGASAGALESIDISEPTSLRRIATTPAGTLHPIYGLFGLAVSSGHAYVANGIFGLAVIDVSDTENLQRVGGVPEYFDGSLAVCGSQLYALASDAFGQGRSLRIFDISDPIRPQQTASFAGSFDTVTVAGRHAFLTGVAGLQVVDVSEPNNPRLVLSYSATGGPLALSGNFAYMANSSGLEIIDLHPPAFAPNSIRRFGDGRVQFTLNTHPGQIYTLEASTNLVNWEQLETRTAVAPKLTFTDTNGAGFSRRFYRAAVH